MTAKRHHSIITIILIIVLCVNLINVQVVHADGETPTEPPVPTEVGTEPPVEATPVPVESTPEPVEATATPLAEILTQLPESTEVVVLDESGDQVPLATQEAAEIVEVIDPMWCPANVLPGGLGCSSSYTSINDLITNMISNTSAYTQNGVIYFTATTDVPLTLTTSSLGTSAFNTLNDFNLSLQGGWDGSTSAPIISGQTNFTNDSITIGTSTNPWVGNITLNDIRFDGVSGVNALTVYTTSGNITLSNVDVFQQTGGNHTALLDSDSGNIVVQNGSTFDGDNSLFNSNSGFSATTTTGSITVTGTNADPIKFKEAKGFFGTDYNGATLSAPTITLSYVIATGNDGNGLSISNGSLVTLNNVTTSINGGNGIAISNSSLISLTNVISGPNSNDNGNGLSGVLINGTGSTIARVTGGIFADNGRYGIELYNGKLFIQTAPTCPTTGNTRNGRGCYNVTPSTDGTAPVITPIVSGTKGANGWYTGDVSVTWTVTDTQSGIFSSSGCTASNLTTETTGITLTCSATNGAGLSKTASVTIKIDKTAPIATLSVTAGTAGNNSWYTSNVTVHTSGIDSISGLTTCTGDQFQTGETTGTIFNGSCTNGAGLIGNASSLNIKLDKTNPTIAFTGRTAPNLNGWNNTTVTANWSCTDALSGVVSASISQTVTTEGAGQSVTGTCIDNAGRTATNTQGGINIDKTVPSLSLPSDITAEATSDTGVVVSYSASVTDNLDGSVTMSCAPASGSLFPIGDTQVTCTATDAHGNTATSKFLIHVTLLVNQAPLPILNSTSEQPKSPSTSAGFIVPLTGGELIDLDCNSVFWMFGVKLSFLNLCDQQTAIHSVGASDLPAKLPAGFSFVMGLDVDIWTNGQLIKELPNGSGIQMDFPAGSKEQLAVLYWNGSKWVEVSQQISMSEISQIISSVNGDGLYHLTNSTMDAFYPILTAHKTGIFILVKK